MITKSMGDLLQNFFDNLSREGIALPTEIQFGKKEYQRLEGEIKSKYFSNDYKPEVIQYFYGASTVLITRKRCKECGE